MYSPIQSQRIFELIAASIEQSILNGELHSGDRLPTERVLGEQFHASRTAVREAMKILAQKGLIEMSPGRGTTVIDATARAMHKALDLMLRVGHTQNANDLVEVRELLEPEIAALAAVRMNESEIAILEAAVQTMDQFQHDADTYIAADNDFHHTLARGSRNELIFILLDSFIDLLSEQRKRIFAVEGGPARGQIYHKQILAAIKRHDAEGARASMKNHLQQIRQDVGLAHTSEN